MFQGPLIRFLGTFAPGPTQSARGSSCQNTTMTPWFVAVSNQLTHYSISYQVIIFLSTDRFLFPIEMEMDAINEYLCPFGVQLNQQQKDYVISINKFYYDFFLAVELRRTQHLLEYGLTKSQVILIVSYGKLEI